MKYPTLSIVVPCYNEEKLITNCFNHILNQTVLPEEVIFVDNNSTDKSKQMAEGFVNKFKGKGVNFKILAAKEQGIIPTRKVGFEAVTTDLIGTVDVDTLIDKDWAPVSEENSSGSIWTDEYTNILSILRL